MDYTFPDDSVNGNHRLTLNQQYASFINQCDAVKEALGFYGSSLSQEYRHAIVQIIKDLSLSPQYAELVRGRFARPDHDLPSPDPLVDRIIRLMNRMPHKTAEVL